MEITQTTARGAGKSKLNLGHRVDSHEKIINTLIAVLAISLILVCIDLYRDSTLYERYSHLEERFNDLQATTQESHYRTSIELRDIKNEDLLLRQCLLLGGWSTCLSK